MKEKETARKEYKQAVERGHGAYLMDQDAPVGTPPPHASAALIAPSSGHRSILSPQDVFTISVGNLPPAATVLIKVTFVSELMVKDGSVLFSLPGSVAPWQGSAALNQTTQVRGGWVGTVGQEALWGGASHLDTPVLHPPPGDGGEGVRGRRRSRFKVSPARRMFRRRVCCPVKHAGGFQRVQPGRVGGDAQQDQQPGLRHSPAQDQGTWIPSWTSLVPTEVPLRPVLL